MKNLALLSIGTLLIVGLTIFDDFKECHPWQMVLKTDATGDTLFGSREELIKRLRNGDPLRIGWYSINPRDSSQSVEHFLDAQFITIANQKEVFAQVTPFLGQKPNLHGDTLSIDLMPSRYTWILGSNGTIASISENYSRDTVYVNESSNFRYRIGWYCPISIVK